MKNLQTLDSEGFLEVLTQLPCSEWTAFVEDCCIHLRRAGGEAIYSPITAVYFFLTGETLHRGSFFHPEISRRFGMPWYEIVEIRYAEIACDCNGHSYNRFLRKRILAAIEPFILEAK